MLSNFPNQKSFAISREAKPQPKEIVYLTSPAPVEILLADAFTPLPEAFVTPDCYITQETEVAVESLSLSSN